MPRTSESTQASTRPAGRSTRAMSAISVSVASCIDRVLSSAITPSAQPSARNDRRRGSEVSRTTLPCAGPAGPASPAAGGEPSARKRLSGKPSGGKPSGGKPSGGKPSRGEPSGGPGTVPVTRSTVWPAAAAIWAARACGPEISMSRWLRRGSHDASCASATAWLNRQYGASDPGSPTAVALAGGLTVTPAVGCGHPLSRMVSSVLPRTRPFITCCDMSS
jgi:hypothetical protein